MVGLAKDPPKSKEAGISRRVNQVGFRTGRPAGIAPPIQLPATGLTRYIALLTRACSDFFMLNLTPPPDQLLQQAIRHHQAGRLAEAEGLYRQVLAVQPNQPDAIRYLGVIEIGRAHV